MEFVGHVSENCLGGVQAILAGFEKLSVRCFGIL